MSNENSSHMRVEVVELFNQIHNLMERHENLRRRFEAHVDRKDFCFDAVETMPVATVSVEEVCSICLNHYEAVTPRTSRTPRRAACGHVYHQFCLAEWFVRSDNETFPLCRHNATKSS